MFKLKITSVSQRDMKALVKYLLGLPGLDSATVSRGLKILPFEVLSVEQEGQAREIQHAIETLGAVCAVEDTNAFVSAQKSPMKSSAVYLKDKKKQHRELYIIIGVSIIMIISFWLSFHFSDDDPKKHIPQTQQAPKEKKQPAPAAAPAKQSEAKSEKKSDKKVAVPAKLPRIAKPTKDIKKDLNKNPYNPDSWKSLADNYEREGDTAAARRAKASYEKAIRTQKILSSMAKEFGNNVRAEVTENAVYYRTNREFKSDEEFYSEASRLRDSLSVKFKGRKLIIENYGADNKVQRVELDP
jgi:outer membrane biosynthesis protein TonB